MDCGYKKISKGGSVYPADETLSTLNGFNPLVEEGGLMSRPTVKSAETEEIVRIGVDNGGAIQQPVRS